MHVSSDFQTSFPITSKLLPLAADSTTLKVIKVASLLIGVSLVLLPFALIADGIYGCLFANIRREATPPQEKPLLPPQPEILPLPLKTISEIPAEIPAPVTEAPVQAELPVIEEPIVSEQTIASEQTEEVPVAAPEKESFWTTKKVAVAAAAAIGIAFALYPSGHVTPPGSGDKPETCDPLSKPASYPKCGLNETHSSIFEKPLPFNLTGQTGTLTAATGGKHVVLSDPKNAPGEIGSPFLLEGPKKPSDLKTETPTEQTAQTGASLRERSLTVQTSASIPTPPVYQMFEKLLINSGELLNSSNSSPDDLLCLGESNPSHQVAVWNPTAVAKETGIALLAIAGLAFLILKCCGKKNSAPVLPLHAQDLAGFKQPPAMAVSEVPQYAPHPANSTLPSRHEPAASEQKIAASDADQPQVDFEAPLSPAASEASLVHFHGLRLKNETFGPLVEESNQALRNIPFIKALSIALGRARFVLEKIAGVTSESQAGLSPGLRFLKERLQTIRSIGTDRALLFTLITAMQDFPFNKLDLTKFSEHDGREIEELITQLNELQEAAIPFLTQTVIDNGEKPYLETALTLDTAKRPTESENRGISSFLTERFAKGVDVRKALEAYSQSLQKIDATAKLDEYSSTLTKLVGKYILVLSANEYKSRELNASEEKE